MYTKALPKTGSLTEYHASTVCLLLFFGAAVVFFLITLVSDSGYPPFTEQTKGGSPLCKQAGKLEMIGL